MSDPTSYQVYQPDVYQPDVYGGDHTPQPSGIHEAGIYADGIYAPIIPPPVTTTLSITDGLELGDVDFVQVLLPEGGLQHFVSETDGVELGDRDRPSRLLINGVISVRQADAFLLDDQTWQRIARYDAVEPPPAVVDQSIAKFQVRIRTSPQSLVDATNDVLRLACTRRVARTLDGLEAGTLDMELENSSGIWSPEVPGVPGEGLRPGAGVEILHTSANSGEAFILDVDRLDVAELISPAFLFVGQIDRVSYSPALTGPRIATIQARDRVKELRRRRLDTEVMTNVNVGSAVTRVLDIAGVASDARTVAAIADTWSLAWFNDRVLDTVLDEMIEAGGYGAYVSKDGVLVFEDRNWDIGRPVVGTYVSFADLTYALDDSRLINVARVRGFPRTIANSPEIVASLESPVTVPRGGAREFFLGYQDPRNQESAPAVNMLEPTAGVDWLLNSSDTGSGTGLTSAGSLTVTFFSESAKVRVFNASTVTGYLVRCNLRGQSVQRSSDVAHEAREEQSIGIYGENGWSADSRLLSSEGEVRARAETMARDHALPQPEIRARLVNQWPQQLEHDVGQVIHVVESFLGLDNQYTIIEIAHQIEAADRGWVHTTDYGLEAARNFETMILDSPTRGTLDFNRIGRVSSYVADTVPLVYSITMRDGIVFGGEE